MAEIVPFHGVRFAARGGPALADLLAPPYAPASPQDRDELLARSPYNVTHLTAGDPAAAPGHRHAGFAATWAGWLAQHTLQRDATPSFYPLEQAFWAPDGRHVRRRGFLAAVRLHDEGIVIPHERTHASICTDQLELLEATRVNFSAPLGLYADERGQVEAALDEATAGQAVADVDTEEGVHLRLWQADRPETLARLAALVEDQRILLADGHHRYATAVACERALDAADPALPATGGHHFVLMMLCSLSDPGLVVYPVHRLLASLEGLSLGRLLEGLSRFFTSRPWTRTCGVLRDAPGPSRGWRSTPAAPPPSS
jgi:uncharacterized protein (DUF1015 family)